MRTISDAYLAEITQKRLTDSREITGIKFEISVFNFILLQTKVTYGTQASN